jgi:hypothetical protein
VSTTEHNEVNVSPILCQQISLKREENSNKLSKFTYKRGTSVENSIFFLKPVCFYIPPLFCGQPSLRVEIPVHSVIAMQVNAGLAHRAAKLAMPLCNAFVDIHHLVFCPRSI